MSTTVVRTTTEKIQDVIDAYASKDGVLVNSQFTGGRDWVLFFAPRPQEGPQIYGRETIGEWPLKDQTANPDYEGGALVAMSRNPSVDFCVPYYRGYPVPHIKVFKYPVDESGTQIFPADGKTYVEQSCTYRWDLSLDDRWGYDFDTEEQVLHAVRMMADAMAVAAGWASHGSEYRLNAHGPAMTAGKPTGLPAS